MTIGILKEHAFLMTDLEKATNTYACAHCDARFTKSCHLSRHARVKPKSSALGKGSLHPRLCLNARSIRKVILASKLVVG